MKNIYLLTAITLAGFISAAPANAANPVPMALVAAVPCAAGAAAGLGVEALVTRGHVGNGLASMSLGCAVGIGAAVGGVAYVEGAFSDPSEEELNAPPEDSQDQVQDEQ